MVAQKMNILMIAPTPFFADRGCHVRILEEARALTALGNKVTICTYHNGRDVPDLNIRRIPRIPWYNKLEAGPSYHMLYLDFLLLLRSLGCTLSEKPDIIHAHLHEGAFIGRFCRQLRHMPLVFDMQDSLSGEMVFYRYLKSDRLSYKLVHGLEEFIDKSADAIITSTTRMAQILKNEFGINDNNVFPIGDSVNTEVFHPNYDTEELRQQLNLPKNKKVVVHLGLLTEYQGIDLLLKSIPRISKEVDAHFLIVGYPNVEKYQKMSQELGVLDHVTFTGRIDYQEVPRYLNLGDIAVSPKISELGGCKLYNFMACALPTVVFDFPSNREILSGLGTYADLEDPESLSTNIIRLLLDERLRQELSGKLREKALKDHSWEKVGEKIMEVYNRLLGNTPIS